MIYGVIILSYFILRKISKLINLVDMNYSYEIYKIGDYYLSKDDRGRFFIYDKDQSPNKFFVLCEDGNILLDDDQTKIEYRTKINKTILEDLENNSYSDIEICLKYGRDLMDENIVKNPRTLDIVYSVFHDILSED